MNKAAFQKLGFDLLVVDRKFMGSIVTTLYLRRSTETVKHRRANEPDPIPFSTVDDAWWFANEDHSARNSES